MSSDAEAAPETPAEKVTLRGPLMVLKMIASSVTAEVFTVSKLKVLCKLALDNLQNVDKASQLEDIRTAGEPNLCYIMTCEVVSIYS